MKKSNLKKLLDQYGFIQQPNEQKHMGVWEIYHSSTHRVSFLAYEDDGKTEVANLGSIFISSIEAFNKGGIDWKNDRYITDRLKMVEQHLKNTNHIPKSL